MAKKLIWIVRKSCFKVCILIQSGLVILECYYLFFPNLERCCRVWKLLQSVKIDLAVSENLCKSLGEWLKTENYRDWNSEKFELIKIQWEMINSSKALKEKYQDSTARLLKFVWKFCNSLYEGLLVTSIVQSRKQKMNAN